MGYETQSKWEGKTSAELKGLAAEQVWPLLADFCNLHKWFKNLNKCYQVEGDLGQPGLIRYCASPPTDPADETLKWVKEKLLIIDPVRRSLCYEMLENNMGFKSYVGTMQAVPVNDIDGCKIEWSFVCDPVEGWRLEDFVSYLDSSLQSIAKKMVEHYSLLSTTG